MRPVKRNHEIVEVSAVLLHETEKAYCFDSGKIDDQRRAIGIWIPKSQCEFTEEDGCLQLPEWLALERGLI